MATEPVAPAAHDEAAILAVIEALRGYLAVRSEPARPLALLAEEWRQAQLFPPTPEQLRIAVGLMSKTSAIRF